LAPLLTGLVLLAGCTILGHDRPANYMVFFSSSNTELSAEARAVVDQAAATIRATHPDSVMIAAGVADGEKLKLAQIRFDVVRNALIADGVDAELIAHTAMVDTALEVGATGDQRVEIKLVSKPAS
jgi:outer membrane protein OmpA-like peptidoglycan-associated protein